MVDTPSATPNTPSWVIHMCDIDFENDAPFQAMTSGARWPKKT